MPRYAWAKHDLALPPRIKRNGALFDAWTQHIDDVEKEAKQEWYRKRRDDKARASRDAADNNDAGINTLLDAMSSDSDVDDDDDDEKKATTKKIKPDVEPDEMERATSVRVQTLIPALFRIAHEAADRYIITTRNQHIAQYMLYWLASKGERGEGLARVYRCAPCKEALNKGARLDVFAFASISPLNRIPMVHTVH